MTNKKPLKTGYVKEADLGILKNIQANPDIKINQRAIAKINNLLSNKVFKESVKEIRADLSFISRKEEGFDTEGLYKEEEELDYASSKKIYLLMTQYGFTRDWFPVFESIVVNNTFSAIIAGETIHIRDLNTVTEAEFEDYKKLNPIAIFIKADTSPAELMDFIEKNNKQLEQLQASYLPNRKERKFNTKTQRDLDIEKIIIENQEKTAREISSIIGEKYDETKGKKNAEIKYSLNYIDKKRSELRKNMLNQ